MKNKKESEIVEVQEVKKSIDLKSQILPFVVGVLVGAVITTGIFLIIRKTDRPRNMPNFDNSGYTMRERPGGNGERTRRSPREKTNETTEETQTNQ